MAMTGETQATVTCAACGDRHTFLGSQRKVTVATQVWAGFAPARNRASLQRDA